MAHAAGVQAVADDADELVEEARGACRAQGERVLR